MGRATAVASASLLVCLRATFCRMPPKNRLFCFESLGLMASTSGTFASRSGRMNLDVACALAVAAAVVVVVVVEAPESADSACWRLACSWLSFSK